MNQSLFREFSDETDDYGDDDLLPTGGSQAVLYASDWTVETILQQIRRGSIKLEPRFQRRDAWPITKKSAYIESILLNLPVPQIVLAESKTTRGEFIVLDGKQRLLALMQFAGLGQGKNNRFPLTDLQFLTSHLNKRLTDFPEGSDEWGQFMTFTVRSVIIRNWPSEDFLDVVFVRLNQNSVKLSPQELRAALFPGAFTDAVDEFTWTSPNLQKLFQTPSGDADFRMRDMELVIRYIGFARYLRSYRGNLKRFLDMVCKIENETDTPGHARAANDLELFDQSLATLFSIFSEKEIARKWDALACRFKGPMNRAILDAHLFYLRDERIADFYLKNGQTVRELAAEVTLDADFVSAVETTTKSIPNVVARLAIWGVYLERATGLALKKPTISQDTTIDV
jgi:hypothetical protein